MAGENSLSVEARLALSEALLKLPDPQFKQLVFALNPPRGILPSDIAALGDRAVVLLQWVEGNGPGLAVLQQVLAQITGQAIAPPPPVNAPTPEPTSIGKIFISYRRDDSASDTGRIYDRLVQEFGRDNIFKDVDSIPFGVDFAQHIDQEVGRCQVLLVVMGKNWLTPRLQNPEDFVRLEIESALGRGIPVVPVFLEGVTSPPPREQLPESLQPLIRRNGTQVGQDPRFHADMGRLVKGLQDYFRQPSRPVQPPPPPVTPPTTPTQTVLGGSASQVNEPTGSVFAGPMSGNTININYASTTPPAPAQDQTSEQITFRGEKAPPPPLTSPFPGTARDATPASTTAPAPAQDQTSDQITFRGEKAPLPLLTSPSPGTARDATPASTTAPRTPIPGPVLPLRPHLSRRRATQILGWGGAGLGATFLGRVLMSSGDSPVPDVPVSPQPSPDLTPVTFEVVTVNPKGEVVERKPGEAKVFSQTIGDSLLDMVAIPGGSFMMGQTEAEKAELIRQVGEKDFNQYFARELPQHEVTLAAFSLGKYPITQAQWRAVAALPKVKLDLNPDPSNFKGDNRPVEQVNWLEAMEFCDRLSQKLGQPYTLPSEAQWEYACRAGTTTPFHFGETITTDLANYRGTDWKVGETTYPGFYGQGPRGAFREQTTEVGSFPPNGFGLLDMHGNVWEWCLDHFHDSYKGAPADGSAWVTGGDSDLRMLRGGSWLNFSWYCRCAYRLSHFPANRRYHLGFRVVSVPPRALGKE